MAESADNPSVHRAGTADGVRAGGHGADEPDGTVRSDTTPAKTRSDGGGTGGDSAAAFEKFGFQDEVSFISTGGGASLEIMKGELLPAIECLSEK